MYRAGAAAVFVIGLAAGCGSAGSGTAASTTTVGPATTVPTTTVPPTAVPTTAGSVPDDPTTTTTESAPEGPVRAERLGVVVLRSERHDPTAFTQGLVWSESGFYESTGRYGVSDVRRVEVDGSVTASSAVEPELFAEGLAVVDDRLIQLTWRENTALVRDRSTLAEVGRFAYQGEGWGLCRLGDGRLVMSDGTDRLTFRDAETFEATGRISVTLDGEPRDRLNELECVDGVVWANVWETDQIVGIDPATGFVLHLVDATGLLDAATAAQAHVLNGIAHDPDRGTFWLTGKYWPTMFEVEFAPL